MPRLPGPSDITYNFYSVPKVCRSIHQILLNKDQSASKMATSPIRAHVLGVLRQSRGFSSSSRRLAPEVKRLGVIGAGQMGLGIALVAAQKARVPVSLIDASDKALDKGLAFAGA
jgi:hypothetical protein